MAYTLLLGVELCMEAKCHASEEDFEVELDNHGVHEGPRTGRLRALNYVSPSNIKREIHS